jgi:hypothetical protein
LGENRRVFSRPFSTGRVLNGALFHASCFTLLSFGTGQREARNETTSIAFSPRLSEGENFNSTPSVGLKPSVAFSPPGFFGEALPPLGWFFSLPLGFQRAFSRSTPFGRKPT